MLRPQWLILLSFCMTFSTACKKRDSKREPSKDKTEDESAVPAKEALEEEEPKQDTGPGQKACAVKITGEQNETATGYYKMVKGQTPPTRTKSVYWANEKQGARIEEHKLPSWVFSARCVWNPGEDSRGGIFISSGRLTKADFPMAPGSYSTIGQLLEQDKQKPGQLLVGVDTSGYSHDAVSGTVEITRFDDKGVAGSFKLSAKPTVGYGKNQGKTEPYNSEKRIQVEGTFDIPCSVAFDQSECKQ